MSTSESGGDIDRVLKEKGRALRSQIQAEDDAPAPVQDMLDQLAD